MARIRVLAENPPPPRGYAEDQLRELRDYITRMKLSRFFPFFLVKTSAANADKHLSSATF